jgi:hypothetical protein
MLTKKYSWHAHRTFQKPEKEDKKRPPRIFKRKDTRYIRPGRHKIRVSDINLIIKNYIGKQPKRQPARRGGETAAKLKALANKAREDKIALEKLIMVKHLSDQKASEELRIRQIKEESLAKNEAERRALQLAHEREITDLKRDNDLLNRELIKQIGARNLALSNLESELYDGIIKTDRSKSATANPRPAGQPGPSREDEEDDEVTGPAFPVLLTKREKQAKRLAELHEMEKTFGKKKDRDRAVKRAGREIAQQASAAAGPLDILPPEPPAGPASQPSQASTAQAFDDSILDEMPAQIGDGVAGETPPTPTARAAGLTNHQIDDMMSDEPRYLATISADQIAGLKDAARVTLDEYGECGFIVNLDPYDEAIKQHWVAVYIDVEKEKVLFYYDSFGDPPTEEIARGLKQLVKSLRLPYYLSARYNTNVNQMENSSRCGIHAMMVLTDLMAGMSTDAATQHGEGAAEAFERYI